MKKIFRNKSILILAIAVVLSLATGISAAVMNGRTDVISNAVNTLLFPIRKGVSGFSNWVESAYGYFYEYESLKEENETLKLRIAEMEEKIRISEADSAENERLRELSGLRQKRRDFELESAGIIEWGASNWTSEFTVSKGEKYGVKVNDCVITEHGYLVGIVSRVGTNWATVTSVIDTGTEIGALVSRTGEPAIAEGDFKLMRESCVKLSYLADGTELLNGDVIITSGNGGVYPSGLTIGTVIDVKTESSGISKYAIVKPSAVFDSLNEVFIIKSFDIVE